MSKTKYFLIHEQGFAYPFAYTEFELKDKIQDMTASTGFRTLGVYEKVGECNISIDAKLDYKLTKKK